MAEETRTQWITVLGEHELNEIEKRGREVAAQQMRDLGRAFDPVVIMPPATPGSTSQGKAIVLQYDWKWETKKKMVGLANEFLRCAFVIGMRDPQLSELLSRIIEEKGLRIEEDDCSQ